MGKIEKVIVDGTTYEIVPEIAPLFSASTAYNKGACVIYNAVLYKFTANHSAGAWTGNDVEAIEVADRLNKISDSVAPEFNASTSYTAGSYVYKNGVLYRFTSNHSGEWTGSDAEVVTVGGELTSIINNPPSQVQTADIETNVFDVAENVITHELTKLSTNGETVTGTLARQRVREFTIPSGCSFLKFTAQSGASDENVWCLYNADTYSQCNPSTLVSSGKYTVASAANPINVLEINSNCKMLLVMSRDSMYLCAVYNVISVEKALLDFANPFDKARIYKKDEYCINDGFLYKCKDDIESAGDFDSDDWELTSYASEMQTEETFLEYSEFVFGRINTITGAVISNTDSTVINKNIIHTDRNIFINLNPLVTVLSIHYYANQNNDSFISSLTRDHYGWQYIKKDSYIRISIGASSIPRRESYINTIAGFVTFKTMHGEMFDQVKQGVDGYYDSEIPRMFQKGASPKTFPLAKCILVAGQSNIDGRVPHGSLPSNLDVALDNIKVNLNSTTGVFTTQGAPTGNVGIDWSLFYALNQLGSTFYKIKKSLGATAISPLGSTSCWTPFYEELSNINNSLLLTFDKQIKKCIEVNPDVFDIRAFVWQQGEGDYINNQTIPRMWKASVDYYNNFRCLVAYVRGVAGNTRLPVVCGTVSHRSGQYDPVVEDATKRVADEDHYMICIDMSGAKLLDSYHFNADSAVYFGYKAYDALIDLGVISGTKINPVQPWTEYTITQNYTKCHSNKSQTVIYDEQSFTCKVTADSGYTLNSVSVTMGGIDITSSAYSSGTVTISNVTGDVVITGTAS